MVHRFVAAADNFVHQLIGDATTGAKLPTFMISLGACGGCALPDNILPFDFWFYIIVYKLFFQLTVFTAWNFTNNVLDCKILFGTNFER